MRILHVFRAPVGGLFRHVFDLAKAQSELGHDVGVICDAKTGGDMAIARLQEMESFCTKGVTRIEMSRLPGLGDAISARRVGEIGKDKSFDIIHGHGAKGGAYARIAAGSMGAKALYTAHGGALHYSWNSVSGALFLGVERMLMARTDGLIFVCDYERKTFDEKIGIGSVPYVVAHNGLWPHEFTPTKLADNPSDILFIGELRKLKGVDVLLKALSKQRPDATATIVGDGPDRKAFEDLARELDLSERVTFTGAMPAHDAFGLGRLMVVPSRAESFPYIVLESMASHKPIIASNVGGIGEILSPERMVPADDVAALTVKIKDYLDNPADAENAAIESAEYLKQHKNARHMATQICSFYSQCLEGSHTCSNAA